MPLPDLLDLAGGLSDSRMIVKRKREREREVFTSLHPFYILYINAYFGCEY